MQTTLGVDDSCDMQILSLWSPADNEGFGECCVGNSLVTQLILVLECDDGENNSVTAVN